MGCSGAGGHHYFCHGSDNEHVRNVGETCRVSRNSVRGSGDMSSHGVSLQVQEATEEDSRGTFCG